MYQAEKFQDGGITMSASSQMTKRVYLKTSYGWDNGIYYSAAEQGYGKRISNSFVWQASDKFNAEINHNFVSLLNKDSDARYYDLHILRGKFIYQMNQYLFFRTIVQYNSLSKVIAPNFLASFTYIPGTVFHVGYGSVFEQTQWDGRNYVDHDKYLRTASGLFLKASYLWRL